MIKNLFARKYDNLLSSKEKKLLENSFFCKDLSEDKRNFLKESAIYDQWSKKRVIDTTDIIYELEDKIAYKFFDQHYEISLKLGFQTSLIFHKEGDISATATIGYCYYMGHGTDIDLSKAYKYFLKAAKKREPMALYHLGFMYHNGEYVKENYHKAFDFYQKAANCNHPEATTMIGLIYDKGVWVKKNDKEAFKWFKISRWY